MNKNDFPQYDTDYISGIMSLRKPQKISLKRLEDILEEVELKKEPDLKGALSEINSLFPICTDFERNFIFLTFALATGVGKTRLMGAFITYLYTQKGIKNFFVVAPNTTIYDKLKQDFGNPSNPKYVFKGVGCFNDPPKVIADDDYKQKQMSFGDSEIKVFVYNISKFNQEDRNMKKANEMLGDSFYNYLSNLDDLVMLMDESHHYRADKSFQALNELRPILGLELTATPFTKKASKQVPFKNVVYEYPLSKAIEDGYTRTPYAVTRTDIDFYNFGDEQLDKIMINDGVLCHEKIKTELEQYADVHGCCVVKPFMMIVCKDTTHADWVLSYVQSNEFKEGKYINKSIVIHSKQGKTEKEGNIKLLLDVERYDNPIEIVIHVDTLKEGWDVNNLYTIVPLRTAASKILREQMVGRGLRLPYGERTGVKEIDAVMLTAHDKFKDILEEAQKGDSIFKAGNVIRIEDIESEKTVTTQVALELDFDGKLEEAYKQTGLEKTDNHNKLIKQADKMLRDNVMEAIKEAKGMELKEDDFEYIAQKAEDTFAEDKDLGETYNENRGPLFFWMQKQAEEESRAIVEKYITIPQIRVSDNGTEEYYFSDFDILLEEFNQAPIDNEILVQNLVKQGEQERIHGEVIDFEGYNPQKVIVELLRSKPEIDYEQCAEMLFKLINQVYSHYVDKFDDEKARNIVMMYKRDIANKIYMQMMEHFACINGFIKEEVIGVRNYNLPQSHSHKEEKNLYKENEGTIKSTLFTGIQKGVFAQAKFDSHPELVLARGLERDEDVKNWLRPAKEEFDITYDRGKRYEPDFVVETEEKIYLVEVKGEDRLHDAGVIAKKERAIQYCKVASDWGNANRYKEWQYLFIPSAQIMESSSFKNLAERFMEL